VSVVINTNNSATVAYGHLAAANSALRRSLNRLSSGYRIVQPADDAGGLAVAMKLGAAVRRTDAVMTNLANAQSFLSVQDGVLKTAASIVERISELKTLSGDVTKSNSDKENYEAEFRSLQAQLLSMATERFNGVSLFTTVSGSTTSPMLSGATLTVFSNESGTQSLQISQPNFSGFGSSTIGGIARAATLQGMSSLLPDSTMETLGLTRAQNGSESSRLSFAIELLATNRQNLEAANSRIVDVDVAAETTQLARSSILVQSGTAMLAQANAAGQISLRLLG
jgi:flagellin